MTSNEDFDTTLLLKRVETLAGTALTVPLFDGGRRKANLAQARSKYDEDVAQYRQQVLVAFREVEDNLADLRLLDDQMREQNDAVRPRNGRRICRARSTRRARSAIWM